MTRYTSFKAFYTDAKSSIEYGVYNNRRECMKANGLSFCYMRNYVNEEPTTILRTDL